jgi:Fur family ferric uptake transcriptional regulator
MNPTRLTQQRRLILEEIQRVPCHPTADELHQRVRQRLPRTSLATVYRNLDRLVAEGLAVCLAAGGGQRRYDGEMAPHCHVRCRNCQRLADVPLPPAATLDQARELTAYEVEDARVEFTGLCPECARAERAGEH